MGKIKDEIENLIEGLYANGRDGEKIAKRLIEAGLRMMLDEGDLDSSHRIVPNAALDGTFHIARRREVEMPDTADMAAALEVAGQQFLHYASHHFLKDTPESKVKGHVNMILADMCFDPLNESTQHRPVELSSRVPVSCHLPALAAELGDEAFIRGLQSALEAAQEPQESESKARSSNGAPAISIAPCRAEIVAYVKSKAAQAAKTNHPHTASVLTALAEELEQHLEERALDIGVALRDFYADCHARNVKAGWWTDLGTGESKKRSVGELFMLMVTELWEAYQAYLTQEPDDKLPQYPGLGVELGDLQIRFADFAGALLAGSIVENSETENPGDAMFREIGVIAERYEAIRKTDAAIGAPETGDFLPAQDVGEMVVAKLEFNGQRPDHKIENRKKADGKRT